MCVQCVQIIVEDIRFQLTCNYNTTNQFFNMVIYL